MPTEWIQMYMHFLTFLAPLDLQVRCNFLHHGRDYVEVGQLWIDHNPIPGLFASCWEAHLQQHIPLLLWLKVSQLNYTPAPWQAQPNSKQATALTVHRVQWITHLVFWSDILGRFFAWALTMEHPLAQARESSMFWPTTLRRPPKQSAKDSGICNTENVHSTPKAQWQLRGLHCKYVYTFSALSM